jgi:hypothetical protein
MRFSRFSATLTLLFGMARAVTCADEPVASAGTSTSEGLEFFETKIRPVLVRECYECHSADSKSLKGSLRLDTRTGTIEGGDSGPSVVPGSPEESTLLSAIRYEDFRMPPKRKLPDSVAADFERWIRMGAPDPRADAPSVKPEHAEKPSSSKDFWAYRPPVRPEVPKVSNTSWIRDNIDSFVLQTLESKSLKPTNEADRRTWLRRVWFDLAGLPPAPEDVERFLADTSADAFEKVVDRLLASPRYGERMGRNWLDLARYAEDQAHTFKARLYPNGYLYRDWLVRAFNDDMPYDRFLKFQIAADLMEGPDGYANRPALGLFALGPVYYQDNGEKDKALADEWDDRLDTLMRGTQAMTVACARCHDHKYDPISMADYYGLAGIFASTEYAEVPAVPASIVEARRQADEVAAEAKLAINRFQAEVAPEARLKQIDRIPDYAKAAWKLVRASQGKTPNEKAIRSEARSARLNETLLKRWTRLFETGSNDAITEAAMGRNRSLAEFRDSFVNDGKMTKVVPADAENAVVKLAAQWLAEAKTALPHRNALLEEFGEDYAFLKPEDRSIVPPGTIPLGNLFDDSKSTTLKSAITSDPFLSVATKDSFGVQQILQGWGDTAIIAPSIRLAFGRIGSDSNAHGQIVNDGWSTDGGIRTEGKSADPKLGRTEQGIGMHANALITFDLDAIRRAGMISSSMPMRFQVDKAGINDDAFSQSKGVNLAVIVSKPQVDRSRFDSILSAHVNGSPVKIVEDDTLYKFSGEIPQKLKADGKFASFDVVLPPEAKYLTIVSTAAGDPGDTNSISSDHAVFAGARITYQADQGNLARNSGRPGQPATASASQDKREAQARLLSELFDEKGLMGTPASEIEPLLDGEPARILAAAKQEAAKAEAAARAIRVPQAHSLVEGPARDLKIYLAGDPKRQGAIAPRKFPSAWSSPDQGTIEPGSSGRMTLAESIASPQNPLTARVIVNRVWASHFGTGLVKTLTNFGQLGDRPSHPELLDYLASEFIDSGWSLKRLHRRIVLSATYRQSSESDIETAREIDPENRLLWRMNRRRLEIEPWRDAVLAIAGQLDPAIGGASESLDESNRRRTLYGTVSRHRLNDLLRLFDFPDPNITAGERSVTTVPLQQLFVLNSDFMVRMSKAMAARVERERSSPEDRVERAFTLAFGRGPTSTELMAAKEFLESPLEEGSDRLSPMEQLCLALLGTNELTYLD